MPINRHVITFLSIVASGIERPITAIIKAMAVPSGMPFATKTSMMGTMPGIGIHRYGKDDGKWHAPPIFCRQVLLKETFGYIAVHCGSNAYAHQDI